MKKHYLLIGVALILVTSLEAGKGKRNRQQPRQRGKVVWQVRTPTSGAGVAAASAAGTGAAAAGDGRQIVWNGGAAAAAAAAGSADARSTAPAARTLNPTEAVAQWGAAKQAFAAVKETEGDERTQAMVELVRAGETYKASQSGGTKSRKAAQAILKESRAKLTARELQEVRAATHGLDFGLSDDEGDVNRHAKVKAAHLVRAANETARNEADAARAATQDRLSDVERQIAALRAVQSGLVTERTAHEATIKDVDAAQEHIAAYQRIQADKLAEQASSLGRTVDAKEGELRQLTEQLATEKDTTTRDSLTKNKADLESTLAELKAKQTDIADQQERMRRRIEAGNELLASDKPLWGLLG